MKTHIIICALALAGSAVAETVTISSLRELDDYARRSGNTVHMKPGVYRLIDLIPMEAIRGRRERQEFHLMDFTGSDNRFELAGVVIEFDTALRAALKPPMHTGEFVVSGSRNTLAGLEIRCLGDGTSPGGALVSITGAGNTLRDGRFLVRGSRPYGYGDLFGKGGPDIISHHKHSGVHITGDDTTVAGCRLVMRSFGHGYFIQAGARNVRFEDCQVEGEMRPTDEILAETSGPAFDVGFRTVMKNRLGVNKVMPGYMKALSEDGFRTYGEIEGAVFRNCRATNMRGGFELRTMAGVLLENCSAIGCERGFWVNRGAVMKNCRGDARFGPLLFIEGAANVEVELLPDESDRIVHALAVICGDDSQVRIREAEGGSRGRKIPVMLGYAPPGMGEGMAPFSERAARRLQLRNETAMPVEVGKLAADSAIESRGTVEPNAGSRVTVSPLR